MTKTDNPIDHNWSNANAVAEFSVIRSDVINRRLCEMGVLRNTKCPASYFRQLDGPFFAPVHENGEVALGLNTNHRFVRELYHGHGSRSVARQALNFAPTVFVRAMAAAPEEKRVEFANVINAWSVAMDRTINEFVADLAERSQD